MVYIEKDKKLSKVKRHGCCKIKPENDKKLKRLINQRKKYIIKEIVRDVRGTRKYEAEKLLKVEDRLVDKRREAEAKRANLVKQWNTLKKNEEDLRSAFITFHQLTIDNRDKINRERAKIKHLRKGRAEKEIAIVETNIKIKYFRLVHEQMKIEHEKHLLYEIFERHLKREVYTSTSDRFGSLYLRWICICLRAAFQKLNFRASMKRAMTFLLQFANYTKYKSVEEVLFRYGLLLDSRDHVEHLAKMRQLSIREHIEDYKRILQKWKTTLVKVNEKLTQQSEKFEEAKRKVIHWEKTVYNIERNAQKLWMDIEMTREALNNVVGLLLLRLKAKVSPSYIKSKQFLHMLSTTEGKILYINKFLGDLMRVKNEVQEIYPEENQVVKLHMATKTVKNPPPRKRVAPKKQKTESHQEFPEISPATARILDTLGNNLKSATEKIRMRIRTAKSDDTSQRSYETTSTADTAESWDTRARAISTWYITKEAKKNAARKLAALAPPTTARETMISAVSSRAGSIPWSVKSGYIPHKYSCVSLTTDPTTNLVDERRTETRDRIIERNFDRYERFVCNNMETDSSVMKINKDTGKLELPKLKFKPKYAPERKSIGITLPRMETGNLRKTRKKRGDDGSCSLKTFSHNISLKSAKSKKDDWTFEEVIQFFKRQAVQQQFTYGNLS